jgi:hypothetical protein
MTDLVTIDVDYENLAKTPSDNDKNQNQIKKQVSLSSEEISLLPDTLLPEVAFGGGNMESQPLLDHHDITYNQFPGNDASPGTHGALDITLRSSQRSGIYYVDFLVHSQIR